MFENLALNSLVLRAVQDAGYQQPSKIQQMAIPPALAGKDVLACAQTGTGKTAAFSLPIIHLLMGEKDKAKQIKSLIVTPTRELAIQIEESLRQYGKYSGLSMAVIFGGVKQENQVKQLKQGVDILVATPGRLKDLIRQGHVALSGVEIFVLDEADKMLDMGFIQDIKWIIKRLPANKQTMLFSATMPNEIMHLADGLLHSPEKVFVTPVSSTVESIAQVLYKVDKANKRNLLVHLLSRQQYNSCLVFTRTKHGADRVSKELNKNNIKAMAIHGDKSQNARQRALNAFKNGEIKVLVATDIAARGLDINELELVINFDLPNIAETYVHRIGRTGRAGKSGLAINFCSIDEQEYLKEIEELIGFELPQGEDNPWPMQVFELIKPVVQPQRQGSVKNGTRKTNRKNK